MKKLLAIVISMAMIVAMMPVGVFAGEGESGTSTSGSESNPFTATYPNSISANSFTDNNKVCYVKDDKILFKETLKEAIDDGASVVYVKENSELRCAKAPATNRTADLTSNLTIYANNANFSYGEVALNSTTAEAPNLELKIYNSKNLYVWGYSPNADVTQTVYMEGCNNVGVSRDTTTGRLFYLSNKATTAGNGTVNAILKDCYVEKSDSPVYLNADGSMTVTGCVFKECAVPINNNYKSVGTRNDKIENCNFINCGTATAGLNQYAAPVRFVNSGNGTFKATVINSTFVGTIGNNGDILLGEGRANKTSNSINLTMRGTSATIQQQEPGYYDVSGSTVGDKVNSVKVSADNDVTTNNNGELILSDVAKIGETGYPTLQAAIAAANAGDIVTLLKDVTLNETLNINKAITIISENENHAITSNVALAVNVNVNDAKVTFSNITINAYKGDNNRAIGLNEVSGLELNLEKCNLNVSQRGITCNGASAKMNLNIIDSEISLVKSGGAAYNYDEEYNNNDKRGISLWEMNDSKVTVKNSTIQGFTYNINNSGNTKKDSMIVDIEKCTFKGRAAINDWTSGTTWNVKDSTIRGLNNQPGITESFGCIVFNTNAEKNTCNVNGCTFETYFNKTGEENSWAKEFMFVVRADGNEITVDKNANGESSYSILRGDKGGISEKNVVGNRNTSTIKVYGGTFSTDPSEYVAAGYYADKSGEAWTVKPVPYTPSTPTDNVTNNPADKNTTADLAPAVKDNKAETTVDAKTADKIVDKAVENNSTEVVIDAAGNNSVASSEVAIPEKTVKELAEKTDANLVIKTDNGQVDLDKAALAAVAEQAGTTGTVKLVVETVKTDENICHVDLKLVTSNGAVKDFKGGNVKVTINLTKELAAKELVCVYIDDNGIYTIVEGVLNADGTYTFTTGHFSEYAVMAKADADKVIADQLNTLIKEVNLKVRTSKTSKKNIKAVVSGDVKAITDAGYTVKYKFYRSEKKSSKYTAAKVKDTNTYINTTGKKGTKYYYKAKALVYDGDKLVGQTVLTQCKYGVRTWSK